MRPSRVPRSAFAIAVIGTALASIALLAAGVQPTSRQPTQVAGNSAQELAIGATPPAVCGSCHRFPPADVLPRSAWHDEIVRMQDIRDQTEQSPAPTATLPPDFTAALAWYEAHAPSALSPIAAWPAPGTRPAFERRSLTPPDAPPTPVVSDAQLLDVDGDGRLELVVCDMRHGLVLLGRPYDPAAPLTPIARVPNPSRAQVVDLDKDGIKDLIVSDLGEFLPRDHANGSVVWLRGLGDGKFAPLGIGGLPRIAGVEAADFDGDGDLDLLVSEFGYRKTGGVVIFENRTTDWAHPAFVPITIDSRPGAVRSLPVDLDGDGRMDFVSVISQEHEVAIAYHNEGHMKFTPVVLFQAPHPNWGSSGLALADLDGDGDLDLLLTNGDTFDDSLLKPYHGIAWLENIGRAKRSRLPGESAVAGGEAGVPRFSYHHLANVPGPHAIAAADLDGDGDLDIVVSALVAGGGGDQDERLPAVVWLEQVARGRFVPHTLKMGFPRHAGLAVGDYNRDGVMDLAFGNMATTGPMSAWVELWQGKR